jgi:hypothetical protein
MEISERGQRFPLQPSTEKLHLCSAALPTELGFGWKSYKGGEKQNLAWK